MSTAVGAAGWPKGDDPEAGGGRPLVPDAARSGGRVAARAGPARRRRDPGKRDAIFYAAIELFAARGFASASMRDIAARAGVGLGTIYDYFPGKDAILLHFLREVLEYLCWTLEEAGRAEADPAGALRRALRMQIDYLGENPDVARITVEASRLGAPGLAPLYGLMARYQELLAALLRDAQEAGQTGRSLAPRIAADALVGALLSSLLGWLGRGAGGPAVTALEPAIDLIFAGLGYRAAPPTACRIAPAAAAGEAVGGGE